MATVLIVDDRSINREYLQSLLNYLNHQTLEAQNGAQALEMIYQQTPDLIISDILMPEMDGYELVRHLKQHEKYKKIPIIFYTATYRKEEATMLGDDLGVEYVLSKPVDPQIMIDTVHKALSVPKNNAVITATPVLTNNEINDNLQKAPQHLMKRWVKLHHSLDQITVLKGLLQTPSDQLVSNQSALLTMVDNLSTDLHDYKKIYVNLFSLIELALEMIAEKDAKKLLQLFCHGTRKSINAEFGVAVILDRETKMRYIVTSGNDGLGFNVDKLTVHVDFIHEICQHQSAFVKSGSDLPTLAWHTTQPTNILCSPLLTTNQVYGFAYFINKKDHVHFDEEDIRMLDTLASELAILYENIELYNLIQQQAAKLQIEGAKLRTAKDELHKSEIIFRQFAENIDDVFWRTSSNLDKIIYISPGYETIWGKSTDSIYQDPCSWQELIVDEDKPKVKSFIKNVLESEQDASLEYRIKHPEGTIRDIYNKTICLKDETGKLHHIIGIASDVTEYLQNQKEIALESELAELLEQDGTLVQRVPDILELICKVFSWDIGELWFVDEERNLLQNIAIWHKKGKEFSTYDSVTLDSTLNLYDDFPSVIWTAKEPRQFENYDRHSLFKRSTIIGDLGLQDAAGLPLLYQDKVLGVMHFFSKQIPPFDNNFNRILSMLGARISDYIHQKLTHEQLLQLVRKGARRVIF